MSDDIKKKKKESYVVSSGRAVVCVQGIKGPGKDIKPEDLKTPANFDKLVKKDRICLKKDYKDNDDSKFRANDIKVENEDDKSDNQKTNITGAQKK